MINNPGEDGRRRESDPVQPASAAAAHGIPYATPSMGCKVGPAGRPEGQSRRHATDSWTHGVCQGIHGVSQPRRNLKSGGEALERCVSIVLTLVLAERLDINGGPAY